jgi:hypothetical protein
MTDVGITNNSQTQPCARYINLVFSNFTVKFTCYITKYDTKIMQARHVTKNKSWKN